MKQRALLHVLAILFLAGCASGNINVTGQHCECRLVGKYHVDKRSFCARPLNAETIKIYLAALEEGPRQGTTSLNVEETLAVNYDVFWTLKKTLGVTSHGLAAVLFMVGCEKESLDEFRSVDVGNSAPLWGQLGIAAHILDKFDESERAFDQAVRLDPDYFATRPVQERIAEAARARRPLQP